MKQRLVKAVLAAAVIALAFAGCENGTQDISGDVSISTKTPPKVDSDSISAKLDARKGDASAWVVSWNAVNADDDSLYYQIYMKPVDKDITIDIGESQYNPAAFGDNGASIPVTDAAVWSAQISRNTVKGLTAGQYVFGIQTRYSSWNEENPVKDNSNIVWASDDKAITLQAMPRTMSTPAATISDDGTKIIFNWTGDAAAQTSYATRSTHWYYAWYESGGTGYSSALDSTPGNNKSGNSDDDWGGIQRGVMDADLLTVTESAAADGKYYLVVPKQGAGQWDIGTYNFMFMEGLNPDLYDASYVEDKGIAVTATVPAP